MLRWNRNHAALVRTLVGIKNGYFLNHHDPKVLQYRLDRDMNFFYSSSLLCVALVT